MPTRFWLASALALTLIFAASDGQAQPEQAVDRSWVRVQKLAPGSDLLLTTASLPTADRRLLIASAQNDLTLLDVGRPGLTESARRVLRRIAAEHPGYFERAAAGNAVIVDDLHLTRDGIFERDRRLAAVDEVVSTVGRPEIRELAVRRRGRGFWGHAGPLGGYFLGAMVGGLAAGYACRCDGGVLAGVALGGVTGAATGWYRASRVSDEVIYTASGAADRP